MLKHLTFSPVSPRTNLRLLGYYALRVCTSRRVRRAATRTLAAGLGAWHGHAQRTTDPALLASLRTQGYVRLGRLLPAQACGEMVAWLRTQAMVAGRGDGRSFTLDTVPAAMNIGDYPLETVVNCPHMLDLANHPKVLALAGAYLGYTPVITLMSLRWSFPSDTMDADVQHFHRDSEPGSIKLLIYVTDVGDSGGPHRYVPRSHLDRMPLRLRRYGDLEVARNYGGSVAITGAAGTAFVIDAKGIHKGTPPKNGARLLLGVQYSLLPCLEYDYAPVPYRGRGRFHPYVNRLMVAADAGNALRVATAAAPTPLPD